MVVEPGFVPYEKEIDGLKEMQETVGGYIDVIYPYDEPVAIVCNDEAIIHNMPFNRSVEGGYGGVFGTFFICGITEDNLCSLPPEQVDRFKRRFHHAEILLGAVENEPVTLKVSPKAKETPKQKGREDFKERE